MTDGRVAQTLRQGADDHVIAFAVRPLELDEVGDADHRGVRGLGFAPQGRQTVGRQAWRAADEVSADAQTVLAEFQVRGPAAGQPAGMQRSAIAVVRAARGEYAQHRGAGFFVLADQPVAVLALHGDAVEDDGLAAADDGAYTAGIEGAGQGDVDRCRRDRTIIHG